MHFAQIFYGSLCLSVIISWLFPLHWRPLGNICSRLVSNSNKITTTRNVHLYMRENAIQTTIRRHQKLSARLDSPTDDCDIAPVSFLNLSKQINTLWPGHLFLKCFSWLPKLLGCLQLHMMTYAGIVSGAKGRYILFREPYHLHISFGCSFRNGITDSARIGFLCYLDRGVEGFETALCQVTVGMYTWPTCTFVHRW